MLNQNQEFDLLKNHFKLYNILENTSKYIIQIVFRTMQNPINYLFSVLFSTKHLKMLSHSHDMC